MTRQTLERDTSGNSQVSTELCGFTKPPLQVARK